MDGILTLILIAIAVVIGLAIAWDHRNGGKAWRSVANYFKAAWESEPATPALTKYQVGEIVANDAMGKVYNDLGETYFWWRSHEPPELFTLYMDIDQFVYIRRPRGLWDFQGIHEEARIETRWRRQPASKRIWDAIQLVVPLAVKTAFRADSRIQTVRFHIGNLDMNNKIATCRVSVEAKRGEREDEWGWRYNRNAKGQLAPVNPHEDAPAPVRTRGFAADPYDFEMQVAQALQARGLSVEVTGGAGDEGVDIIARDPTPVTGGTYLVQCKRYAPDRKVGVGEVRELYGALQEKRASKGILATTASFTVPAIRFAEDKPLELLDGAQLAAFIGEYAPDNATPGAGPPTESDLDSELLNAASHGDASEVARLLVRGANIAARNDDGRTPLHEVAGFNAEPAVAALLLDRGADIAARDNNGRTPLHWAAWNNTEPAVVALLLDRGADIEARTDSGLTPLHWAVMKNAAPAIAASLLDRGADIEARTDSGLTPLHLAAFNRETAVAELLIDRGADIAARDDNGKTPLCLAAFNREPAVAELLIDRGSDIEARTDTGGTPLHITAAHNAESAVAALLLDRGADIEARNDIGGTPLHIAAMNNAAPAIAALLLDRGANIAARTDIGWTPLHIAAMKNAAPAVAASLLDRGANIAARDNNGRTPLHWAAMNNAEPAVAALLLNRGADIAARDDNGWTPLHWAAMKNAAPAIAASLLDRGADIAAREDMGGWTPLHVAARFNAEPAVVALLLDRGADPNALTGDGDTPYDLALERKEPNEEIARLLRG